MRRKLSEEESAKLVGILKDRFEKNMSRHENLNWSDIEELDSRVGLVVSFKYKS